MDIISLLVHLIVGILRALFGESEKTANPNDFSIRSKAVPKGDRGPYNYGNKPMAPPKTLEEILEEVRRQAELKRQQAGKPAPQRLPTAAAAPRQEQPRRVELAERTLEPTIKNKLSEREDKPKPPPGRVVDQPLRSKTQQAPVPAMSETGLLVKLKPTEPLPVSPVLPRMPAEMLSPQAAAAELAASSARKRGDAGVDLLAALRGSSVAGKRNAARQAIVLNEVFGPPRAYRPYRPRGF